MQSSTATPLQPAGPDATQGATGPRRPPRVGVIGPAGNVEGRDDVVTPWMRDPRRSIASFVNIGDLFVHDSSLKILDYERVVNVPIGGNTPVERSLEVCADLDYLFLRGSNYINPNGDWSAHNRVLERLDKPVHAFGVGVQVPEGSTNYLNESGQRFFGIIGERARSIAVRGTHSAEALASIGIKDCRIIGCPTVFRHRRPKLELRRIDSGAIRSLGFTLRRKTHGSHTLQRYLLRTLDEQFALSILCAGELEEKRLAYARRGLLGDDGARVREEAVASLIAEHWLYGPTDPLLELYERALVVPESVAQFEAALAGLDAVTGFRLHGNLLALANGIPALYVTYDTRTVEFVKTLGIPAINVRQADRFSFRDAWDKARWDSFETTYTRRFRELRAYLDENAMPHRLGTAPKPKPAATPASAV